MPFLLPNQQRQSTEGTKENKKNTSPNQRPDHPFFVENAKAQ